MDENGDVNEMRDTCFFSIVKDVVLDIVKTDEIGTMKKDLISTKGMIKDWQFSSLSQIIDKHCQLLSNAKYEILFVTSYWEGESASAQKISSELKKICNVGSKISIKILVDNGKPSNLWKNTRVIAGTELNTMKLGAMTPDADVKVKSKHMPVLGTIHAKFIVLDRSIAILSSNNVQDRGNLEFSCTLFGPVVNGFVNIFETLWEDKLQEISELIHVETPLCSESMRDILFVNRKAYGSLYPDIVSPQNCAWWTLMSLAEKEVFICTPTLNARHACEAVFDACCRDVKVVLVLTKYFNDMKENLPLQGGTNYFATRQLLQKLKEKKKDCNLHLHWYVRKGENVAKKGFHSHVKFLSVDRKISIFGNGNMDTQSWYHSMEVNLVLDDPFVSEKMTLQLMNVTGLD